MQITFRAKLVVLVGAAALALVAVTVASSLLAIPQARELATLEGRLVPKLETGPALTAQLERIKHGLQDAVAAQDREALEATRGSKEVLLARLRASSGVLDAAEAAAAERAIEAYYSDAYDVSRRLIANESGERLGPAVQAMQDKQRQATAALEAATVLRRGELTQGFATVRAARERANWLRLGISFAGLVLLVGLSTWVSRNVLRTLDHLSRGFARFGRGDLGEPIPEAASDELGKVVREANAMAGHLRAHAEERDRSDWLKAGQAALAQELRDALEPDEVARRAVAFLVQRTEAVAGALYVQDEQGRFRLTGQCAGSSAADHAAPPVFERGEGLVGRAAGSEEALLIEDLPDQYLPIRSGLGASPPRALLLVPLRRADQVSGVLELAFFRTPDATTRQLLAAVGEPVAVALAVSRAHQSTSRLLEETQRQAARLAASEEETRIANEELQVQQEELRQTNEELEMQRHALQRQNDELEGARRTLHQKAEELAAVSSYKTQFLANMSHELRTPLNSMLLLSHLLGDNEEGNLSDKQVEHARTVHSAGKDLLALINQVLDLAKIESGKQEVHLETVSVAELAEHAERLFRPLARNKGLQLSIEVEDAAPPQLVTDRQRVEQIVTNLLGNAIKFTERGSVTLRIGPPAAAARGIGSSADAAGMLALAVSDTGLGIAPQDQAAVFRAFEQVESRSNRRYGGTGLGLAIARESAILLGGDIQLESTPGRGSTFTCFIPLRAATALADASPEPAAEAAEQAAPVLGDDPAQLAVAEPYLLIVEDDPVTAVQVVELAHARGLKAVVAGDGETGLRLASRHRPMGIFLDVRLPAMDGWAVMDRLRADPSTSAVPVHFVSAGEGRSRALAMGAIGYLTKPASVGELADVVHMLAPAAADPAARVLVVEDDAIDGAEVVELLARAGLVARHVPSVRGALEALRTDRYACMVLDLGLPDGDGLALLQTLARESPADTPPVVVHTARALTREEARRIEDYAEAVVVKDGRSSERLLEEVRLFVHHLKQDGTARRPRRLPSPRAGTRLEGRRILVADDDMRTVYAVAALLRARGAEVLVADSGREALEILDGHPDVAAVLMDVMMPEMDGYEAMRRLRGDARFRSLPIIALTAKAMKGERERCIEAGASDYLAKPVEVDQLFAMLDACLREVPRRAG